MASLMRRSIIQHEMRDRVLWDDEVDPKEVAWDRVRTFPLPVPDLGEEESEGKVVSEWIEEALQ